MQESRVGRLGVCVFLARLCHFVREVIGTPSERDVKLLREDTVAFLMQK